MNYYGNITSKNQININSTIYNVKRIKNVINGRRRTNIIWYRINYNFRYWRRNTKLIFFYNFPLWNTIIIILTVKHLLVYCQSHHIDTRKSLEMPYNLFEALSPIQHQQNHHISKTYSYVQFNLRKLLYYLYM